MLDGRRTRERMPSPQLRMHSLAVFGPLRLFFLTHSRPLPSSPPPSPLCSCRFDFNRAVLLPFPDIHSQCCLASTCLRGKGFGGGVLPKLRESVGSFSFNHFSLGDSFKDVEVLSYEKFRACCFLRCDREVGCFSVPVPPKFSCKDPTVSGRASRGRLNVDKCGST